MRRLPASLLPFAFLLFIALPSFAQLGRDPNPSALTFGRMLIMGQVTEAGSNAPLGNVQIYLRQFSGNMVGRTISSATGSFQLPGISPDNYVLVAERDGYLPVEEDLDLSTSQYSVSVSLSMHPAAPGVVPPSGTVSARTLGIPEHAWEQYQKGLSELHDKKNPEGSLPYFQSALKDAPKFCEAEFQSGLAYRSLKRNEEAESAYRKTLELCKDRFVNTNFRLASVLTDLKKYSDAQVFAEKGLASRPDSWLGNFELGRALYGLGREREAEQSVRKAVKLNPGLVKGYLLLANIHMAQNQPAAVVEDLDEYLRADPDGPQSAQARRVREQMQKQVDNSKKPTAVKSPSS